MHEITEIELKKRLVFDNPWWENQSIPAEIKGWSRRAYFEGFMGLVHESSVNRAVVLMGPRRVGKTVMLTQAIQKLIDDGVAPTRICYVSVDTPTYTGCSLETLLTWFMQIHGHSRTDSLFMIYDEVQYHQDWERHLKSLVDSFPSIRFVASGSAAAALKMKSRESGAGRFTDFLLPPLNFAEFLRFRKLENDLIDLEKCTYDIKGMNAAFIDYVNFGGFPEAVMKPEVRLAMDRFVADDIIDKVLLRDIPGLYGIQNTQELKKFFTVLAYNSGMEVSLHKLSQASGVAKNTLRKYLDYLEAAFLIQRLYPMTQNARRFKRRTHFKVYLTNPCIRAALFGPIDADSDAMGSMAETAFVSQYAPTIMAEMFYYARWRNGEVDLVFLDPPTQRPYNAVEIKWSDRLVKRPMAELKSLISFCKMNGLSTASVAARSARADLTCVGIEIVIRPISVKCYIRAKVLVDEPLRKGLDPRSLMPFGAKPYTFTLPAS